MWKWASTKLWTFSSKQPLKLIINSANKNKIPFQRLAASRVTGTDTDAFAFAIGGVASCTYFLPYKIHAHYCRKCPY